MWKNSNLFLLVSVLVFLLFSDSLWADVTLTDQEYNELMTLLEISEQEMSLSETALKEALSIQKNLEIELKTALSIQEMQSQLINELRISLDGLRIEKPLSLDLGSTWNHEDGLGVYAGISLDF